MEKEDVYRIAKEVARQEIETILPIHGEIVDLKYAVKQLIEAQLSTDKG